MFCSDGFALMWVWFMGFSVEIGPAWVVALSSPVWVVDCGSCIDVDRGGLAGLESVVLVGF